jgi:PST family polysaccharide transporter
VVRGGKNLLIRQIAGLVISGVGSIAIARLIGLRGYGSYAAVFEVTFFIQSLLEFNFDLFLVRRSTAAKEVYDTVFVLLLVSAVLGTGGVIAGIPLIGHFVHVPQFSHVALWMFASIPVMHLQQVPLSKLERELNYGVIGKGEMAGQTMFFVVGVTLAAMHYGVWAPVIAWWTQQTILLVIFWVKAAYRPAFGAQMPLVREAMRFGVAATSANFVYSLRNLVNPVVVSRILGVRAVAIVGLTLNLIDQVAFIKQVTYRIALTVLGRVQDSASRFAAVVREGTMIQLLVVGIPFVGFACAAGILVPLLFGSKWTGVAHVFPLVAISYLAYVGGSLYTGGLLAKGNPWLTIAPNMMNSVLLWLAAVVLVRRFGVIGYGLAELFTIPSVLLTLIIYTISFGRQHLAVPAIWFLSIAAAILAPVVSWWLLLALLVPICVRPSRRGLFAVIELGMSETSVGRRASERLKVLRGGSASIVASTATPNLRRDEEDLVRGLGSLGIEAIVVRSPHRHRTWFRIGRPMSDLVEAASIRGSLWRAVGIGGPPELIFSGTTTGALLLPQPWLQRTAVGGDGLLEPDRLGWRNAPTRYLERRCLKRVAAVLPSTEASAREVSSWAGAETSVIVFPPLIECADDVPDDSRRGIICYVTDPWDGGLDIAVTSFGAISGNEHELSIVGIEERKARRFLRNQRVAVPDGVRFAGRLTMGECRGLATRSLVYVGASRRDDSPSVQLNALADGALLVTVPSAGARAPFEYAWRLDAGLVSALIDARSLVTPMRRALSYPPSEAALYRRRARELLQPLAPEQYLRRLHDEVLPAMGKSAAAAQRLTARPPEGDNPHSA